jgi:HAD superfamily hydrolase (TIGR01509 family)
MAIAGSRMSRRPSIRRPRRADPPPNAMRVRRVSLPPVSSLRAVVFDYGNTLIEFSGRQIAYSTRALGAFLREHLGPFAEERLDALGEAARLEPYANGYRENDFGEISRELVRELYAREPTAEELAALLDVRREAFVGSIHVDPRVLALLERLTSRFALGLLSNYPSGVAIRESLEHTGIARHLRAVVVSGEVGFIKPHPLPFRTILDELGVDRSQVVHVGDNWLADVQGAKRLGIACIQMRRWLPLEKFEPGESDQEPDAVIEDLDELGGILLE